ncbi:WD40-repeat-containing domain protein [Chaetomium strumarium]|uniref:Elongator complex protein 2 n=1 Tax=Chaetomium strumarium TaxID=1170767 RepID=A0AAJ0GXM8_9PEZI|nr:WD40-repeat-containing domain protein [Chaetomium strumarium]
MSDERESESTRTSESMGGTTVESQYLSAGANRYAAAADWGEAGLAAFGSDTNVCLWDPTDPRGISRILGGHVAHVRAVKFLPRDEGEKTAHLVTGGDDKQLRLWAIDSETGAASCVQHVQEHSEPINCIAAVRGAASANVARRIFVTGGADATVKVWAREGSELALLQTIKTTKRYMPLTVALVALDEEGSALMLAVGGTTNSVQIFTASGADGIEGVEFSLQATLSGHENWIRSLDFICEKPEQGSDILLASASQDKYIRLWRIHQGTALSALNAAGLDLSAEALTPGNKMHKISAGGTKYCIMFEALLLGHEDWIYSARWSRAADGRLQLLSASADNSLSLWESDRESGIWITMVRLGEVSREKGATTATGSIGGFWTGLWSPSGTTVITLGRTGSWRRWDYDAAEDVWKQSFAISGHTRAVTGISWSQDGSYLLSTSSDQTTRLHAQWVVDETRASHSWHEMSRPQIHGYDLNCISTLGRSSFVSGADEKLMRVFTEPKAVARMRSRLTNATTTTTAAANPSEADDLPDAANMPVLGLSNKAISTIDDDDAGLSSALVTAADPSNPSSDRDALVDPASAVRKSALEIDHPPFEESLSRHTLWPEVEKLYGHGYEISCLAASHDGTLIASACKASSINHAVIRLFETRRWTEVRPPLPAHTLTVTRVRFSPDDRFLLSVGRDRQWAVFERVADDEGYKYELRQANPKGHTRMILDAAWAPMPADGDGSSTRLFATAGRDKQVKVWIRSDGGGQFEPAKAITEDHPVTALDFVPGLSKAGLLLLAVGTEAGKLLVLSLKVEGREVDVVSTMSVRPELCLPKAVMQLAWRPAREGQQGRDLAVAGEDGSLRIYSFPLL